MTQGELQLEKPVLRMRVLSRRDSPDFAIDTEYLLGGRVDGVNVKAKVFAGDSIVPVECMVRYDKIVDGYLTEPEVL